MRPFSVSCFEEDRMRFLSNLQMSQSRTWQNSVDLAGAPSQSSAGNVKNIFERSGMVQSIALGLELHRRAADYEAVVTAGTQAALVYALIRMLTKRLKRKTESPHIALEIWFSQLHRFSIKRFLYKLAFSQATLIMVFSRREQELYSEWLGLTKERFRFIPFHTTITEPRLKETNDDDSWEVISAGSSCRDHDTFLCAMEKLGARKGVIVASQAQLADREIPQNIKAYSHIPWEQYVSFLRKSSICVISLEKGTFRSSGQAVALEAMALGVPVLASRSSPLVDYISDGDTGMFFEPGNADDLTEKIERLMGNPDLRRRLAENAYRQVLDHYGYEEYTQGIFSAIEEACGGNKEPQG